MILDRVQTLELELNGGRGLAIQ